MNETNRLVITLFAATCIIFAAVVIFIAWARPEGAIERIADLSEFFADHNTNTGKLIVTMSALAFAILALLAIIVELAPEDEPKDLKVEQAGATTIIPAEALRMRLEEALLALPEVTAARSRVWTRDRGIAAGLELTVTPNANLTSVTQEAARVVVDVVQTDLGLPVAGVPSVKMSFGGSKAPATAAPAATTEPAAVADTAPSEPSPWARPAEEEPERKPMGVVEAETAPGHADSSPGPLVYEPAPDEPRDEPHQS